MKKKTFVTIFEKIQNVHLTKDVGQIAYFMHKVLNYESRLVGHKIDKSYSYLDSEVRGLKLDLLPRLKIGRISLSLTYYLIMNAKKIDVLHLFHHATKTYFYIWLYKLLNKKGIVYLKSDVVVIGLNEYKSFINPKYKLRNLFFRKVIDSIDIISVETQYVYNLVQEIYPNYKEKFLYLQNGLDLKKSYEYSNPMPFNKKENIIMTVGRIGTHQKNNEVLLESISKIDLKDWKVYLIGPIEKDFEDYIISYFKKFPLLKDKVIFTGNISNKKDLYDFYNRSKIFCLTSRDESFALVYVEAIAYGNYILSTDVGAIEDITKKQKLGKVFKDEEELTKYLKYYMQNQGILEENYQNAVKHANDNFNWSSIVNKLEGRIKEIEKQ